MSLLDVLLMNLSDTAVRAGDGSLQFGNGWRSVADCTDFEKSMVQRENGRCCYGKTQMIKLELLPTMERWSGDLVDMGTWLGRVHFPNGHVRYAKYSTVVEALVSNLYDHFREEGETDDLGDICYRAQVTGEPSAVDPSQSLSEPDEIIPVRIEVEPDRMTWRALYCPRRKQMIGPHSKFVADKVQHSFELVRRNDRLHLVHADGADRTLCGEPAAGETIAFFSYDYPNKPEDPSEPAPRDLYAEWSDRVVCRQCLLHDQALNPEG